MQEDGTKGPCVVEFSRELGWLTRVERNPDGSIDQVEYFKGQEVERIRRRGPQR